MPMFWSKKPKAEKNYEQAAPKSKGAPGYKAKAPAKTGKVASKAVADKAAKKSAPSVPALQSGVSSSLAQVILRPRITEKSGILSQSGVYTFVVSSGADKASIARAVKALYKVTAVKVAIINSPSKAVFVKGRHGTVSGFRKAMVTVKEGDKIDFV